MKSCHQCFFVCLFVLVFLWATEDRIAEVFSLAELIHALKHWKHRIWSLDSETSHPLTCISHRDPFQLFSFNYIVTWSRCRTGVTSEWLFVYLTAESPPETGRQAATFHQVRMCPTAPSMSFEPQAAEPQPSQWAQ